MRRPSPGLTPEGLPCLGLVTVICVCFALLGWGAATLAALALLALAANFFHDPERVIPQEPGLAVSPADGRVSAVERAADPFTGETRTVVRIFMNVFNVHVNRAPVAGSVAAIRYHPGKFFNASFDKASQHNERCALSLTGEDGRTWTVVQIAGLIARRIVCLADPGDSLARGQRLGMIKFGSRLDVYLPEDYIAKVAVGERVLAGQSVIAAAK
ncbi:MAG: phosphatidylserine decarboxylase family protein [Desulfovibrionaceae bacterium]|nr:phosphatidylserine decarboxylase family protein [Desulfovibrionaceae bacterium]MBF0513475.1 phosphatidylserine decarboxylase family protein [Desulfovibrionaceae bacterium]